MLTLDFIIQDGYRYICDDGEGGSIYAKDKGKCYLYYVVHGKLCIGKVNRVPKKDLVLHNTIKEVLANG